MKRSLLNKNFFIKNLALLSMSVFFNIVSDDNNNIGTGVSLMPPIVVSNTNNANTLTTIFLDYFSFSERANALLGMHLFWFFFFSFLIVFFGFFLVLVSNPIYSVISLIIVYLSAAFLLITLGIHFLAVIFILVYLGAVIVLFLFIVMMLNIKVQHTFNFLSLAPFFLLLLVFFFFFNEGFFFFKQGTFFNKIEDFSEIGFLDFFSISNLLESHLNLSYLQSLNFQTENVSILGFLLYTFFFVELLLCSYVLLVAMLGCIAITLIKENKKLKKQDAMLQLLHKNTFFKRIKLQ